MAGNPRKVVQVSYASSGENFHLAALCDDGTIWMISVDPDNVRKWDRLPPVPGSLTTAPEAAKG